MSIITVVDGVEYEGFIGISAVDSISNLCNQYRQECSMEDGGESFPIKRGSSVQVKVEGVQVFNGHCEISDSTTEKENHSVKTEGRDVNRDILKSDLDPSVNIKGPVSLADVIKKSLKAADIEREIIDQTGGIDDLTKRELLNDDVGVKLFEYWKELARKRQTLITSNREDQIVLFRPGTLKYEYKLVNTLHDDGGRNNIIGSSLKCDDSERCHKYIVHSQYNFSVKRNKSLPAEGNQAQNIFDTDATDKKESSDRMKTLQAHLAGETPGTETHTAILNAIAAESGGVTDKKRRSMVNTEGVAYDYAIPPGSVRHIIAEKPSDDDECERLAQWYANLERAKSVTYSCSVPYLTVDGTPWRSGYLIDVQDEDEDIDATMLITQVDFSVSKSKTGSAEEMANLTLTVPDAFSEDATVDSALVRINRIGGNWNNGVFQ